MQCPRMEGREYKYIQVQVTVTTQMKPYLNALPQQIQHFILGFDGPTAIILTFVKHSLHTGVTAFKSFCNGFWNFSLFLAEAFSLRNIKEHKISPY